MKQLAFSRTIRLSAVLKSSDFIGTVAGNVICHRYTLTKELGGGFPLRKAGGFAPLISAAKALHRLAGDKVATLVPREVCPQVFRAN